MAVFAQLAFSFGYFAPPVEAPPTAVHVYSVEQGELPIKINTNIEAEGLRLDQSGNGAYSTVPIPGSVWLLGTGLFGLMALRGKNSPKGRKRSTV